MAQTNYTPISLYYSATASSVPVNTNLVPGELAINTNDGKLFYKDSSGVVQTLASKATAALPTTTTGSGSIVLATSPTITTPVIATTIGVGGATPSASGSGITFPATQSDSSNVNTLDDYEEGTWTPVVTASAGSITTYTSAGQYRKIGGLVVAQFQYGITNNGTGATAIILSGLPFAGTANTSGGLAREIAVTGVCGGAYLYTTTALLIVTAAGAYMGATGWQVVGTISYQV